MGSYAFPQGLPSVPDGDISPVSIGSPHIKCHLRPIGGSVRLPNGSTDREDMSWTGVAVYCVPSTGIFPWPSI